MKLRWIENEAPARYVLQRCAKDSEAPIVTRIQNENKYGAAYLLAVFAPYSLDHWTTRHKATPAAENKQLRRNQTTAQNNETKNPKTQHENKNPQNMKNRTNESNQTTRKQNAPDPRRNRNTQTDRAARGFENSWL